MPKNKRQAGNAKATVDLSLVLTAHNEGLLAHKSLLSIIRALKRLTVAGKTYEALIHLDRADAKTEAYFARLTDRGQKPLLSADFADFAKHARIFANDFGDLGRSRNFCVQKARGEFIAVLDLDDLVSENYFVAGLQTLTGAGGRKVIFHPEIILSFFEDEPVHFCLEKYSQSVSRLDDAYKLAARNLWGSPALARREVYLKHPFRETKAGIGYEDWGFAIDTVADGFAHRVVPEAVLFYRRKGVAESLMQNSLSKAHSTDYSPLFDFELIAQKSPETPPETALGLKFKIKSGLVKKYVELRNHKFINTLFSPPARLAKKVLGRKLVKPNAEVNYELAENFLGANVMEEWKNVALIENRLFPNATRLQKLDFWAPERDFSAFEAYRRLATQAKHKADYLFIVPWLKVGGADKVLLNYLQAFAELNPKLRFAVITTLNETSDWADKLPPNAVLVEFGRITAGLDDYMRGILFARLVLQFQPQVLHNINSRYFYGWAHDHAELLAGRFRVLVSLFSVTPDPDDPRDRNGYIDPYLLRIDPLVEKIFTDNSVLPQFYSENYGLDRQKFIVEHQPQALLPLKSGAKLSENDGKFHILWASRIDPYKNIAVVAAIARKLAETDSKIVVDVYGRIEPDFKREAMSLLKNCPNLTYHGAFDGIASIAPGRFDCFLYTSLADGLPNILLEIAGCGLPIISTAVGGIPDLVQNRKTGLVVADPADADEFIKSIQLLRSAPQLGAKLARNARQLLKKEFSWEKYLRTVKRDFREIL